VKDYDPLNPVLPYESLMLEAHKPSKKRKKLVKTRKGDKVEPRRHSLFPEKALALLEEFKNTGIFANPYRKNGRYWAFIESLINLGINKSHSYASVRDEMQKLLSVYTTSNGANGWKSFEKPKNRDVVFSKDIRGRIIQNARVLQRLADNNPYGYKLAQLHACVDILADADGLPLFRLHTDIENLHSVKPINELRKRFSKSNPARLNR